MVTDYNPYIVLDETTFRKMMECLNLAKAMAERFCPHMTEEYELALKRVHSHAESFIGSQNKPVTKKAYEQ